MAVSQMEPTDARRAFPCFDEPNMKAIFSVTLGRHRDMTALSNMPLINTTQMQVTLFYSFKSIHFASVDDCIYGSFTCNYNISLLFHHIGKAWMDFIGTISLLRFPCQLTWSPLLWPISRKLKLTSVMRPGSSTFTHALRLATRPSEFIPSFLHQFNFIITFAR
jgi:hypothetical protein